MLRAVLPHNLYNVISTGIRVLKSGNRIGIYQLFLYTVSLFVIPIDYLLSLVQRVLMNRQQENRLPLIFLSGYSRSGTTLVYQALSKAWDIEYFNNLLILFHRSYLLSNYLYRKISNSRSSDFTSFYGLSMGLSGTNDGAQIFYQWASEDDFIHDVPLPSLTRDRIRRFFATHEYLLKKPLLTKNCNIYLLFDQYAQLLPMSYFIFVKRDPARVIQSTLKARKFVQGDSSIRWEFSFKKLREGGAEEDPIREICLNLKACYDRIDDLARVIPDSRLIVIEYEEFCKDPVTVIKDLTKRIFKTDVDADRLAQQFKPFHASEGPVLSTPERDRIRSVVQEVFSA